jgi:hypothetical protein
MPVSTTCSPILCPSFTNYVTSPSRMKKILPPTSIVGLVRLFKDEKYHNQSVFIHLFTDVTSMRRCGAFHNGSRVRSLSCSLSACCAFCVCCLPCVFSLSVSVFLLSLERALSSFLYQFFSLPLFFPSSCNSLFSSIVASTLFVAFFFWFPSWNFFSFFLFLFHPTGRLFPRLEFGVAD